MEIRDKQDYQCSFCGFECKYPSRIEAHVRTHTREKPFSCDKCEHRFLSTRDLNEHVRRQHQQQLSGSDEKEFKCSMCSFATHWQTALKRHVPTHFEERSFSCKHPGCEYAAKSPGVLKQHVAYRHTNENKYLCPVKDCGYRGKMAIDLRLHSIKHSAWRPFVCDFEGCNYQAKSSAPLKFHKLRKHSSGNKPFACSMCDYCATTKSDLIAHKITHTQEKSVKCHFSGCTYSCKAKTRLRYHVLNCHTEKKLKCDFTECLFSATTGTALIKHKKRVHSEKDLTCPHCNYRGADRWYMQRHIENHKKNQRIPCPNKGCNFQARNRVFLKRHLEFHEENLSCTVLGCGYVGTSPSSTSWKQHMQLHDPTDRPFHCPLCPKYFPTNMQLSSLLRSHTQERPFKCPECDYGSVSKPNLMKHVRRVHPTASSKFDDEAVCDHCGVNYGCADGLAMHRIKLKTAVVVLTRLQIQTVP